MYENYGKNMRRTNNKPEDYSMFTFLGAVMVLTLVICLINAFLVQCKVSGCSKRRKDGANHIYCAEHECSHRDCYERRTSDDYCDVHEEVYQKKVAEWEAKRPTQYVKCTAPGCFVRLPEDDPLGYCEIHYCPGCQDFSYKTPVTDGFLACEKHRCNYEGCDYPMWYVYRFCDSHAHMLVYNGLVKDGRCAFASCEENALEGQNFCETHTCEEAGCDHGTEPGYDMCGYHLTWVEDRENFLIGKALKPSGIYSDSYSSKSHSTSYEHHSAVDDYDDPGDYADDYEDYFDDWDDAYNYWEDHN